MTEATLIDWKDPSWGEGDKGLGAFDGGFLTFTHRETTPRQVRVHVRILNVGAESVWGYRRDPLPWLEACVSAVNEFINLPQDWDSHGGVATTLEAAGGALRTLVAIMSRPNPMPELTPVPNGGLALEWHGSGVDLEIEFGAYNDASVYYRDESRDIEWDRSLSDVQDELEKYLSQIEL